MAVENCHHVCHHRQLIATLKRSQRGAIAKSQYWQCSMDLSNYLVIIWWMMTIIQKGKKWRNKQFEEKQLWEVTKGVRALSLSQCQYWDFRAKHKDKDHLQRNMLCHVFSFLPHLSLVGLDMKRTEWNFYQTRHSAGELLYDKFVRPRKPYACKFHIFHSHNLNDVSSFLILFFLYNIFPFLYDFHGKALKTELLSINLKFPWNQPVRK